jgi:hypothetical protein
VLAAVHALHESSGGVCHGALGPERIVVAPDGRVFVVEHVLASALDCHTTSTQEQFWRDYRVAIVEEDETPRFGQRTDVLQAGLITLALVLGRLLRRDEFPRQVGGLLLGATETGPLGSRMPVGLGLRAWLARALQLGSKDSYATVGQALKGLEQVLEGVDGYAADSTAVAAAGPGGFRRPSRRGGTGSERVRAPRRRRTSRAEPRDRRATECLVTVAGVGRQDGHDRLKGPGITLRERSPAGRGIHRPARDVTRARGRALARHGVGCDGGAGLGGLADDPGRRGLHCRRCPFAACDDAEVRNAPRRDAGSDPVPLRHVATGTGRHPARAYPGNAGAADVRRRGVAETPRSRPSGELIVRRAAPHSRGGRPEHLALTRRRRRNRPAAVAAQPAASEIMDPTPAGPPPPAAPDNTALPAPAAAQGASPATPPGRRGERRTGSAGNRRTAPRVERAVRCPVGRISVTAPLSMLINEKGYQLGVSPGAAIPLPVGRHDIELVNESIGFRETRSVEVTAGRTLPIVVTLPKGTVSFNAIPLGGRTARRSARPRRERRDGCRAA